MCDRCRVPGCLLDYNGKACKNARKEHCPDVVFTNADHIRSMTDEELADWMAECNAYGEGAIESQWIPWLKQSYKEEA